MRTILLSLALIAGASGASAAIPRDALWVVLRSCVVAYKTAGIPFPCLAVSPASSTGPGYAVLKAPFSATRVLVMPIEKVEGIESPILQRADASAYWRAALDARRFVTEALEGRFSLSEVALAVNSSVGRSQDHLHIHLDCIQPSVRSAVQRHASAFTARWTPLKFPLEGARYFGMKVGASEVDRFNPFASLASLPGARKDLRATSLAVVSAPASDPGGAFMFWPTAAAGAPSRSFSTRRALWRPDRPPADQHRRRLLTPPRNWAVREARSGHRWHDLSLQRRKGHRSHHGQARRQYAEGTAHRRFRRHRCRTDIKRRERKQRRLT